MTRAFRWFTEIGLNNFYPKFCCILRKLGRKSEKLTIGNTQKFLGKNIVGERKFCNTEIQLRSFALGTTRKLSGDSMELDDAIGRIQLESTSLDQTIFQVEDVSFLFIRELRGLWYFLFELRECLLQNWRFWSWCAQSRKGLQWARLVLPYIWDVGS